MSMSLSCIMSSSNVVDALARLRSVALTVCRLKSGVSARRASMPRTSGGWCRRRHELRWCGAASAAVRDCMCLCDSCARGWRAGLFLFLGSVKMGAQSSAIARITACDQLVASSYGATGEVTRPLRDSYCDPSAFRRCARRPLLATILLMAQLTAARRKPFEVHQHRD